MVTIGNLEVHFDVEGEGDQAVFARLFEQHMRTWNRLQCEAQQRRKHAEAERMLGDRSGEDQE